MRWDVSPTLACELGDEGPWVKHVKIAWQACATDAPDVRLPSHPRSRVDGPPDLASVLAYWAPMFHPLYFGLGWSRPDIGLMRWRDMGYPVLDPVLGATLRWWNKERVDDVLAWAEITDFFLRWEEVFVMLTNTHVPVGAEIRPDPVLARLREQPAWKDVWGGGDNALHLDHVMGPLMDTTHAGRHLGKRDGGPRIYEDPAEGSVLLLDTYGGWYRRLTKAVPASNDRAAPWPVEVVIKPVGWLGTFRASPSTGIWHRTEDWIHLLGNEGI